MHRVTDGGVATDSDAADDDNDDDDEDDYGLIFQRNRIYSAIRTTRSSAKLSRAIRRYPELVHLREESTCYTYLHLVVASSNEESQVTMVPMIYLLSNAGLNVNAVDCRNRTALHLAIVKKSSALMVALMRVGTDQRVTDYRGVIDEIPGEGREYLMEVFERYTPDIWSAAVGDDLGAVYVLVNSWCRVKVKRQYGGRALTLIEYLHLTGAASPELVSLLASYEMTMEFVHAALAGDEAAMLDILMDESECDVDIMDISFVDPLTGSLRPRSLRDTAIDLNHPGRVLQLLTSKSKRHEASTGVPDIPIDSFAADTPDLDEGEVLGLAYLRASSPHRQIQGLHDMSSDDLHSEIKLSEINPHLMIDNVKDVAGVKDFYEDHTSSRSKGNDLIVLGEEEVIDNTVTSARRGELRKTGEVRGHEKVKHAGKVKTKERVKADNKRIRGKVLLEGRAVPDGRKNRRRNGIESHTSREEDTEDKGRSPGDTKMRKTQTDRSEEEEESQGEVELDRKQESQREAELDRKRHKGPRKKGLKNVSSLCLIS